MSPGGDHPSVVATERVWEALFLFLERSLELQWRVHLTNPLMTSSLVPK